MKVSYIRNYKTFKDESLTLALGFFDGLHIGHIKVLNEALKVSKETNTKVAMLTFNIPVQTYISKDKTQNLTSINTKIEYLSKMGFDAIYIIELTDDFLNLDRDEFIEYFLRNERNVVVGFDYTFGKDGLGNADYLKEKLGKKVFIVDKETKNEEKIGTKKIKEYLKNGDIKNANNLLGRNYMIEGFIYKRNKFNSMVANDLFIPRNGEYKMRLYGNNIDITFVGKIKIKDNDECLVIKSDDENYNNLVFLKRVMYKLEFIS